MIYTVTFNPAIDYVVFLDELSPGEVNRTKRESLQFGGKGINVSVMLKRLGVDSVALGFVAGFTGDAVENYLKGEGVRCDFVRLPVGQTRINVKVKAKEETEINGQGPMIDARAIEQLYQKLDKMQAGDILVLAGSIPSSMPQNTYEQILARYADKGIRFVVDAAKDLLTRCLKYKPYLIKPNHIELAELFGRQTLSQYAIIDCAARLQEQGAQNVLVSMAGDGAVLLDENGCIHRIKAPQGKVINSVGAGDSMVAGFLAGAGSDYDTALLVGTACGSATAFSEGLAYGMQVENLIVELKAMGH